MRRLHSRWAFKFVSKGILVVSLLFTAYAYSAQTSFLPSIFHLLFDDQQPPEPEPEPEVRMARVERTNQTACWDNTGTVINCAGTGQDGELQAGIVWPNPRFTDNGDGTILDELTGLVWLKDGSCLTMADDFIIGDGVCGLSDGSQQGDWHMPNIRELLSLVDIGSQSAGLPAGHPFTLSDPNTSPTSAYFSTTYFIPFSNTEIFAQHVGLDFDTPKLASGNGIFDRLQRTNSDEFLLPVRHRNPATGELHIAETNAPAPVEATDQLTCSSSVGWVKCGSPKRDATDQWSVAFPTPRFVDSRNGTVTDKLTDLVWMIDYECADFAGLDWQSALSAARSFASGQCGVADGSSAGDWRVPNANELLSIHAVPRKSLRHELFGVDDNTYWSSTSYVADPSNVLVINGSGLIAKIKQLDSRTIIVRNSEGSND